MSIEKIFESVDSGKQVKSEAVLDSILTPQQLGYALEVCGYNLRSLKTSINAIKRVGKKESGTMLVEQFEFDISNAIDLLSPIFKKMILEVEVRKMRLDGSVAVLPSARWSYVGGGSNGVLSSSTAFSKDGGSSWKQSN